MPLIDIIEQLSTEPRQQEEEYEHSSDFTEWFYNNICLEKGFSIWSVLHELAKDSSYKSMCEQCKSLVNTSVTKNKTREELVAATEDLKNQLLACVGNYEEHF